MNKNRDLTETTKLELLTLALKATETNINNRVEAIEKAYFRFYSLVHSKNEINQDQAD